MKKIAFKSLRLLRRGFTMVELLLAVFLLAIGMLGLLSIFPIGADWTRQITEESITQNVARCAMGVIEARYRQGGTHGSQLASVTSPTLVALPGLDTIPPAERAYQYGASSPFPASKPDAATYFWTALCRLSPDQTTGGQGARYDIYILVMKKGDPNDKYDFPGSPANMVAFAGTRAASGENYIPLVVRDKYFRTVKNGSGEYINATRRNVPQIGDYAVGIESGTAFRAVADATSMFTRPEIKGTFSAPGSDSVEDVLWVPPPNPMERAPSDPTPSPLVFVFSTTITY